jgi:hypothetical protein
MSLYRLYTNTLATLDAAAVLDIREDGVITGVIISSCGNWTVGVQVGLLYEVSFSSTSSFVSNDVTQVIATATNAGIGSASSNTAASNIAIPCNTRVSAGDRIYFHVALLTGALALHRAYAELLCEDGISGKKTASRR